MNEKIVAEAFNTGVRGDETGWYNELILLYIDGTWEKIFKTRSYCSKQCIGVEHLRGKTRGQVIAKLEKLYYEDKLDGKFMD